METIAVGHASSPPIALPEAGEPITGLSAIELVDAHGNVRPLEEVENEVIRFAITHYRGQMSEVARRLRIGRSTLYRKLKDLGFDEADSDATADVASG
jgi:DNA-binding NtrC family response regulator